MGLRDLTGVWSSELKDGWESCTFYYDRASHRDERREGVYRRYGDLPDGCHYGACIVPGNGDGPDLCTILIVGRMREICAHTPSTRASGRTPRDPWPLAVAAAPSGKSIVWIEDGELWAWQEDRKERRFLPDDGRCLTVRLGGRRVRDARMCADGVLGLRCEGGETFGYLCDGDILLMPWENGWTALEEEIWRAKDFHGILPESVAVLVRGEDEVFDYYDCGAQRVCFGPELETIKEGILAENYMLGAVTIPAWVKQVDAFAFGDCTALRELAVEGDLSRVANWAEDAFSGCPCEGYYRTLRRQAAVWGERSQRIWSAPVRDVEEILHDPELFDLAKQIEPGLGDGARFMLRPGSGREIRILVDAHDGEKCLLAMLRFTQAAEKKGYLTGPVEEEEM